MRHIVHRLLKILAVLLGGLVMYVAVMLPLLVFPATRTPAHVDVLLVLGPPEPWRFDEVEALTSQGATDNVLISVPSDREKWPKECVSPEQFTFSITCFTPEPFTTQGEARELAATMRQQGWRTALVVTATPHVSRARFVIDKCVPAGVDFVDGGAWSWTFAFKYQGPAFLKAIFVTNTC